MNIKQLQAYCTKSNKNIIIHAGKLCGVVKPNFKTGNTNVPRPTLTHRQHMQLCQTPNFSEVFTK